MGGVDPYSKPKCMIRSMKFYWMKLVDSLCNIYLRKIIATFFKEKKIKVLKRTKKIVRKLNNNKTKNLYFISSK